MMTTDQIQTPRASLRLFVWSALSLIVVLTLGGPLVGSQTNAVPGSRRATIAAGKAVLDEFPRLRISPRQPVEQDPIDFRVFLGMGVPCDTTASAITLRGTTIVIDAVVNRYQGICIFLAVPLFATPRVDHLPEGHYVVEVYRTERPEPQRRELWATAEFDVVRRPTIAESEPNDHLAQANEIIPNASIIGIFDQPGDIDLFRVEAEWSERLTIDVEAERLDPPSSADPVLTVFGPDAISVAMNDNLGSSLDPLLDVPVLLGRNGPYWVQVRDPRGVGGPQARYRITIRVTQGQPEREPNDEFTDATPMEGELTAFGDLNRTGDADTFRFYAEQEQMVRIDVGARSLRRPSDALIWLMLFDESERLLAESRPSEASPDPHLRLRAPAAGVYFIRLRNTLADSGTNFRYDVTLRLNEAEGKYGRREKLIGHSPGHKGQGRRQSGKSHHVSPRNRSHSQPERSDWRSGPTGRAGDGASGLRRDSI